VVNSGQACYLKKNKIVQYEDFFHCKS
jgi:hypothetical protein